MNVNTFICCTKKYKDVRGNSRIDVALVYSVIGWGYDPTQIRNSLYDDRTDKNFPFDSAKKKSTAIIHRAAGSVTLFCKGACELILSSSSMYLNDAGKCVPMTKEKRSELETAIYTITRLGLRSIALSHKDFASVTDLPANWRETPPDSNGLCIDAILGIMDPLKENARKSIDIIKSAGISVMMVNPNPNPNCHSLTLILILTLTLPCRR